MSYRWMMLWLAAAATVGTLPGRTQGLGLVTEPLIADLQIGMARNRLALIALLTPLCLALARNAPAPDSVLSVWPRVYGRAHLGRIQGAAQAMTVLASAIGPLLLAACVEWTGSHAGMFKHSRGHHRSRRDCGARQSPTAFLLGRRVHLTP